MTEAKAGSIAAVVGDEPALFREMAVHARDAICVLARAADDSVALVFANAAFERLFSVTAAALAADGFGWLAAVAEPDRRAIRAALEERDGGDHEARIATADGGARVVRLRFSPLAPSSTARALCVVTGHDVTDRFQSVQALHASEQRLRLITDSMPGYIAYVGAEDLRYRMVSARFETSFGRPRTDIVGRHIREIIGEANYAFALPHIERVRAGQAASYENTFGLAEGRRWIRVNYVPDVDERGEVVGIVVLSYDVTEQRAAQEALRAERDFAEGLIETARAAVLVLDTAGRIVRYNRFLEELSGRLSTEVRGEDWVQCFVPVDEHGAARAFFEAALGEASTPGESVSVVVPGGGLRRVEWYARPLRDPSGAVSGLLFIGHDVTERREAEQARARLERELLQAQKMEAIGKLAGGVAHDMNNILATVMGMASILELALPPDSEEARQAAAIVASAARGADLTRNLLGFARKGSYRKELFDLHRLVTQVEEVFLRTLPKRVVIELRLDAARSLVEGDPSQLQQALVNLALNAVDAIAERGTLSIRTSNVEFSAEQTTRGRPRPGRYVCLTVADDGVGMDAATMARACEPFFTTKEPGRGTGLGLAMVYGTAQAHGGHLALQSAPGAGTVVDLYLPEATAATAPPPSAAITDPTTTGATGAILLVDDEPLVRESFKVMLERLGHPVVEAGSGAEALRQLEQPGASFALVLLDFVMPGLDGAAVFRELRARAPALPVVLCSGHGRDADLQSISSEPRVVLLRKPFALPELAAAIRRLLAPAAARPHT